LHKGLVIEQCSVALAIINPSGQQDQVGLNLLHLLKISRAQSASRCKLDHAASPKCCFAPCSNSHVINQAMDTHSQSASGGTGREEFIVQNGVSL
jgi:hypothetical protein